VFARSQFWNWIFSAIFIVTMSSCAGAGGCQGCASEPLPGGQLPPDQTVEGGGQIRLTPEGFGKLKELIPPLINSNFAGGFCLPTGRALLTDYCWKTDGQCATGCKVNLNLNSTQIAPTNNQTLNIKIDLSASTTVPLTPPFPFGRCDMRVTFDSVKADLDIGFDVDPVSGELKINLANINDTDLSGVNFSDCGIGSTLLNLVTSILDSFLGDFVIQLLRPAINNIIQGFLPNPLGIAGVTDLGQLLAGASPGTQGKLETRLVPGGFVTLNNGGMTLGLITGFNADEDSATRTPELDNEVALCVPPFAAPNFAAAPASLPTTSRNTFTLLPADEFNGEPNPPDADIALGFSETSLDLLGHHAVTSGAVCLGLGPKTLPQLSLGLLSALIRSLQDVGSEQGNDPLLIVTRPQKPLDFAIGTGTPESPAITLGLKDFEIDFYGFIFERYVRLFTMSLNANVGINLTFEQMPGQSAKIKPTLVGLSKDNVQVTVLNNEFMRETKGELESLLPTILDLVASNLNLPAFDVPTFAGFTLSNLSIKKVTTSQDEFVALFAKLGSSPMLRRLSISNPGLATVLDRVETVSINPLHSIMDRATPTVRKVTVPDIDKVRDALLRRAGGEMPSVDVELASTDIADRDLEWSWNLNDGMWRPFMPGGVQRISDVAFAYQGKYTIGLISRLKGDYTTTAQAIELPVVIDSVGPRFLAKKTYWSQDSVDVQGFDLVSNDVIKIAFGRPGDDGPATAWQTGAKATLSRLQAETLMINQELVVFLEDELGNQTSELLSNGFHGQGDGPGGCKCNTSGSMGVDNWMLALFTALVLVGRRRSARSQRTKRDAWSLMLLVACFGFTATLPACDCGSKSGIPLDTPPGSNGAFSDVAVSPAGDIWVSAYSRTYGDLLVAKVAGPGRVPNESWEWVDGVPALDPTFLGSKIRGGIVEDGDDVGLYTSIAVANDGTPMVAYFDKTSGSLKFAAKVLDQWQIHVVDGGTGPLTDAPGVNAGMYAAITLRTDDGRPGIAYLAHKVDAMGKYAEVRFATASVALPTASTDWQMVVVDTGPIPAADPMRPDSYPLPAGLGLFVDVARRPDQSPVLVYYDRGNGDLKLASFNTTDNKFDPPRVVDGGEPGGDAGWSPTVAIDVTGVVNIAYVSARQDDLVFISDVPDAKPEVVDNGYRIVGMTSDGLPKPEFHFVGDDATMIIAGVGPTIVYQDATSHELLITQRASDNIWRRATIAGNEDPFVGAYGFYASSAVSGNSLVVSNWVVNLATEEDWVEVFVRQLTVD
jgi:hypothetical protein